MNAVLPDGNKQHLILSMDNVRLKGKLCLGGRTGNNAGWRGVGLCVSCLTLTRLFSCRQLLVTAVSGRHISSSSFAPGRLPFLLFFHVPPPLKCPGGNFELQQSDWFSDFSENQSPLASFRIYSRIYSFPEILRCLTLKTGYVLSRNVGNELSTDAT
jgi:hypothetical protein